MTPADRLWHRLRTQRLRPRPALSVSEWADAHRVVTIGAVKGPWRTARTPYLREIMDAYDQEGVRRITVKKGSQTGGTELQYNCIMFSADRRPGLMLYVYPDAGSASDQNSIRFLPALKASIPHCLTPRKHDQKSKRLTLTSCDIVFRGSVSEHQLESFPASKVFIDELDRCGPRTVHLAYQRTKTFPDGKLIAVGKPGIAGTGIDAEYEMSDRRVYMVPCPRCGVYHERTFSRVRWPGKDKDGRTTEDSRDVSNTSAAAQAAARAHAWFKCPACKARISKDDNPWQLALGVWTPLGCSVTDLTKGPEGTWINAPGSLVGDPALLTQDHRGYHIPELISGLIPNPYGEAAAAYVARGGRIDQDFVTDHLGSAWRLAGASVEVQQLRAAIAADAAAGKAYRMGRVPPPVLALVAAVDVQETGCYASVYGFSARGEETYLVWREYIPAPSVPGTDSLAVLDRLLYQRVFERDGRALPIRARCIDTGDRTDEVYEYIRRRKGVIGVRGVGVGGKHTQHLGAPFRWTRTDKWPDGKPMPGSVHVLRIDSDYWKRSVLRQLGITAGDDAGLSITDQDQDTASPAGVVWHLPDDVPVEHLEQLTAEHFVTRVERGRAVRHWELRPGRRHNHDFDTACYARALAHAMGIRTFDPAAAAEPGPAEEQTAPPPPQSVVVKSPDQPRPPPHKRIETGTRLLPRRERP